MTPLLPYLAIQGSSVSLAGHMRANMHAVIVELGLQKKKLFFESYTFAFPSTASVDIGVSA